MGIAGVSWGRAVLGLTDWGTAQGQLQPAQKVTPAALLTAPSLPAVPSLKQSRAQTLSSVQLFLAKP